MKKTDEKEVRIKLRSTIYEVEASLFSDDYDNGDFSVIEEDTENIEPDEIEINTVGTRRIADGRFEVYYDESEVTGMEGSSTSVSFDM